MQFTVLFTASVLVSPFTCLKSLARKSKSMISAASSRFTVHAHPTVPTTIGIRMTAPLEMEPSEFVSAEAMNAASIPTNILPWPTLHQALLDRSNPAHMNTNLL